MTTSNNTICLPAHILDADITPRAREVLMLLASQTSAAKPALWICQKTIAERLRCSVATVARAIQKLVEAKLIAETGKLHEGRHKFYHVRWARDENLKAVTKKITKPVRKVTVTGSVMPAQAGIPFERERNLFELQNPLHSERSPNPEKMDASLRWHDKPITTDNRIAYYAEIARQKYVENRRRYQAELLSLR